MRVLEALLWYQLVTSAIVALIAGAVALYVQFAVRRGWVTTTRQVTGISCDHKTVERCKQSCAACDTTCTTRTFHACTLRVEGTDRRLQKNYIESPPTVGSEVTVHYSPAAPSATMTLRPFRRALLVAILGVVCLVAGGYAAFLYAFRRNEAVQGAAAVATGVSLLGNLFGGPSVTVTSVSAR